VLKNYVGFSGRARRKEYWMFYLFNLIATIITETLDYFLMNNNSFSVITAIYALAILLPSLAVTWRRLHDTGRSGGWFFISLVPFVGGIILIVFLCLDSEPNDNKYGPNPNMDVKSVY
jgi:uncharacterized membrane protein YhaH (DUF805 family)